ncbi:hypothetical protein FGIG_06949 [Fasciola gigantica]|uniref:Uncharacterized protein n=1 Tax=Fasciola gigantica TaxID=46835 RepID=A0A504Y6X5_FASGI|nr:hypothetical protein FGIG_06949 [Fasciola gigantica]
MFQKREEKKLSPKDKITPMDILLFVILVITIVMAFLALALEPDYYASNASNNVTTTTTTTITPSTATQNVTETPRSINVNRLVSAIFCVLAFLCIVSSIVLHTILFCTCEKRARKMNISVIVLVWFGCKYHLIIHLPEIVFQQWAFTKLLREVDNFREKLRKAPILGRTNILCGKTAKFKGYHFPFCCFVQHR